MSGQITTVVTHHEEFKEEQRTAWPLSNGENAVELSQSRYQGTFGGESLILQTASHPS
jgi:hypothetical protein